MHVMRVMNVIRVMSATSFPRMVSALSVRRIIYVIPVMRLPSLSLLICTLTVMRVIRVMHVKRVMGPIPLSQVNLFLTLS